MAGAAGTADSAAIKQRTAALSVLSNSGLILLKVIAGTVTGSVAILTEAVHSSIDLVASVVAFFSVRKADEPADETHRYGHEKIENLAAAIEGILILVGSAAIAFEAIRHLVNHGQVQNVGIGIAVIGISLAANLVVSLRLAATARRTGSPALAGDAAHLGTDALTSAAVLVGLVLVDLTGAQWIDPVVALLVASVIVAFREGTSLEDAHRTAHELQDVIAARLAGADVLIHLEPEDRVRPGEVLLEGVRGG